MALAKISVTKPTKWDSGVAVAKGKQSLSLLESHENELSPRIPEEERAQHKANVADLENRRKNQQSFLSEQMSNTAAQDETVKKINKRVVSIRQIVVASNANDTIKKAYGVGSRIHLLVNGVSSAANTIIEAYKQHTAWSNYAGILEKDIAELSTLEEMLYSADNNQEKSKYARKSATMDKNTLQRAVEDGVTKISTLGVHEFELNNPSVAKLFADLIPASASKTKKAGAEKTAKA